MSTEFEFVTKIRRKYQLERVGDDCAILPLNSSRDQVVTADLLIQDVDFRLEWASPDSIGHKSLAVSLSDIAAMGANPKWALLSIGVPSHIWITDFVDGFYEGWFALARLFDIELVGGDVSRTPEKIVIDSIAAGEVPKGNAVSRSGSIPGESILVSGSLGGAAGGLTLLESGVCDDVPDMNPKFRGLIGRQLRPTPQVTLGNTLCAQGLVTAMIDISDGLSSDLDHLCRSSGVGARIAVEMLPIDPNLSELAITDEERLGLALHGGEDFELLCTADPNRVSTLEKLGFTLIGETTSSSGTLELSVGGHARDLPAKGFSHF